MSVYRMTNDLAVVHYGHILVIVHKEFKLMVFV